MSYAQRTMQRDERDDKIAELEAMIDKADAMYAEKVYELQQLQKSLIPHWQKRADERIEAGTSTKPTIVDLEDEEHRTWLMRLVGGEITKLVTYKPDAPPLIFWGFEVETSDGKVYEAVLSEFSFDCISPNPKLKSEDGE